MPTKPAIFVAAQVRAYQRSLAPEPRRRVKAAIFALATAEGDVKALEGKLEGLWRLRVGEHRFAYRHHKGRIEVFYAAPRTIIYEYLAAHLQELLSR